MASRTETVIIGDSSIRAVVVDFNAPATTDYTDDDVLSNSATNGEGEPLEFEDAVLEGGAAKCIGGSIAFSEDGILATTELLLFSQPPTATEMDDNAAYGGIGAADVPYYLGSVSFAAAADIGAGAFAAASSPSVASPLLIRSSAGTSVYGILVWRDAETNETAGMTVTVTLYFA